MHEHSNGLDDVADIHRREQEEEEERNSSSKKSSPAGSLTVSNPGDPSENQADAIAKKVAGGQNASLSSLLSTSGSLNAKHNGSAVEIPNGFSSQLSGTKGSGQSLDDKTLGEMGSKMGTDFSDVKIHTGNYANDMSESINAKAFTHGQDIYFKGGNYNPSSGEGKELLAHELVHTKQGGNAIQRKVVGDPTLKYKATKGDNFRKVALLLGVPVWKLEEFNPILAKKYKRGEELQIGTEIWYPGDKTGRQLPDSIKFRDIPDTKDEVDVMTQGKKTEENIKILDQTQGKGEIASAKGKEEEARAIQYGKDNMPTADVAAIWAESIIIELKKRVENYNAALDIFYVYLDNAGVKKKMGVEVLKSILGIMGKVLLGPLGGVLIDVIKDAVGITTTVATTSAHLIENLKITGESLKIAGEGSKDKILESKKEKADLKLAYFFSFNREKTAKAMNDLNEAQPWYRMLATDTFNTLLKSTTVHEGKDADQMGPQTDGKQDAIDYVNALRTKEDTLKAQTNSDYSVEKFVQALVFGWISINNNSTKKRFKPRTGYIQINLREPMEKDGVHPENWKIEKVEIHAPHSESLIELLSTFGGGADQTVNLAEVPVPRRYKFFNSANHSIKVWSEGPPSVYKIHGGFAVKAGGEDLFNMLSNKNLNIALSTAEGKKYPLKEIETSEDFDLLEKL